MRCHGIRCHPAVMGSMMRRGGPTVGFVDDYASNSDHELAAVIRELHAVERAALIVGRRHRKGHPLRVDGGFGRADRRTAG